MNDLRVLCLDIEGGHGGSSRSLFESVRHLDRSRVEVEVWCRRPGWVVEGYTDLGVPCRVFPELPKVSSLPRLTRNLFVHTLAARDFRRHRRKLIEASAEIDARFDLVHFNHEAFYLLAAWLKRRITCALTMHLRTRLYGNRFSRRQYRIIARTMDHLVFITENEQETLRRHGAEAPGTVIYNIAPPPGEDVTPHPMVADDGRFKIASLSNYGYNRGTDRLVDLAEALVRAGRRDFLFVVAGDMTLPRSLPGELGRIARQGGTLADYAAARGVGDMFLFLGHVDEPDRVLAAGRVLAKPTRLDDPWARDILEALAMGRPVMSVGTYDRFVATGRTGLLQPGFDPDEAAAFFIRLAGDDDLTARMGEAARQCIRRYCHGPERAADLLAVWEKAAGRG